MSNDFRNLIEGMGENWDFILDFLSDLAKIRDPYLTPILSDLEKEYGILSDETKSDSERIDFLASVKYAPKGTGSDDYLQDQLEKAGFTGIQVHINSPAVDPGLFFGGAGGELIVNNIAYDRSIIEARYDRKHWNYVFFIGGTAYRNSRDQIIFIDPYVISDSLKVSFRNIVLKYKPQHSWAIAVVNISDYFEFSSSDVSETSTTQGFADDDQTTGGYWFDVFE